MLRKQIVRKILLLLALAATFGASAASAITFPWPNPQLHHRIILYADQTLGSEMSEHPEWFDKDFLVAGFYIKDVVYGKSDDAIHKYASLRQKIFDKNKWYAGTYISGTTVVRELSLSKYPVNAVSMEDLSIKTHYLGTWLREPDQTVVDLSDVHSRRDLQNFIRLLWLHVMTPIRFIDNAAVHPGVAKMQPWSVYCQNMQELRNIAQGLKASTIFNIFVRPWEMSNQDMKQLVEAVGAGNAVSLPLPWSLSIKDDKNANAWAIYRYRQLLDNGIVVIVIPSVEAPEEKLIAWVSSWRRPNDHIYFATPTWKAPAW
jgi:hypothetical protein